MWTNNSNSYETTTQYVEQFIKPWWTPDPTELSILVYEVVEPASSSRSSGKISGLDLSKVIALRRRPDPHFIYFSYHAMMKFTLVIFLNGYEESQQKFYKH